MQLSDLDGFGLMAKFPEQFFWLRCINKFQRKFHLVGPESSIAFKHEMGLATCKGKIFSPFFIGAKLLVQGAGFDCSTAIPKHKAMSAPTMMHPPTRHRH